MERSDDCFPLIHLEFRFLDVVHSRLSRRGYEKLVDDLCNILPMLARRIQSAAKKFRNHFFLIRATFLAQLVVVCSKAVDVVLDDVVVKHFSNDCLVFPVVPTNSGAGYDLKRRRRKSAHEGMGHIVYKLVCHGAGVLDVAFLTPTDDGVCQTWYHIVSQEFRHRDFNILHHLRCGDG